MRQVLFISALVLLAGCTHTDDLFKSYGKDVTVMRQLEKFDKITAGEKFDIFLVQDSAKAGLVELTAGEHVIEGYTTDVRDGELLIQNSNKFNWVRKLKVRQKVVVYFEKLSTLQINGSAKFSSLDTIRGGAGSVLNINHGGLEDANLLVATNYINANCTNTGGVFLSGSCFLFAASVDDISFIDSRFLKAEKAYLSSFSRQDSHVDAINELEIKLYGVGNVYYRNTPANILNIRDEGEGQVVKY